MRMRIRIRIQLVTLMRIRILLFILMRIRIHNNALSLSSLSAIGTGCGLLAQCKELTRGPPELVQHFRLWGSSHRRNSAACPKYDMVWLHRSPISVGRRGVIFSFKWFLPALLHVEEGGGVRHPVVARRWWMEPAPTTAKKGCLLYLFLLHAFTFLPILVMKTMAATQEKSRTNPTITLANRVQWF